MRRRFGQAHQARKSALARTLVRRPVLKVTGEVRGRRGQACGRGPAGPHGVRHLAPPGEFAGFPAHARLQDGHVRPDDAYDADQTGAGRRTVIRDDDAVEVGGIDQAQGVVFPRDGGAQRRGGGSRQRKNGLAPGFFRRDDQHRGFGFHAFSILRPDRP